MVQPIRRLPELMLCIAATLTLHAQESGPTSLVVTYRCLPEKRTDLRNYMRQDGLQRLEGYRRNAILSGYRVLLSRYVDINNWDMLLLLAFPDYTAVEKWKRVEHESPAGLPGNVLAMAASISTYPVDLLRHKATEGTPLQPVFLVIPYSYSSGAPAYLKYMDDYEMPQFDRWIAAGVLANYEIHLQRYGAARPWDALLILEYKDDDSLGRREKKWRESAGSNQSVLEKEAVIADELRLPH